MALNIKNERVCHLARLAAERAGASQVSVIEVALEHYLARLDDGSVGGGGAVTERATRIEQSLAPMRALLTQDDRAALRRELDELYDAETGMPR